MPGRTENLHDYLIPTIGDVPPDQSIIVEVPDPHGPYGAKGLGEHVLIPTAPAILNAIHDATGARCAAFAGHPGQVMAAIQARCAAMAEPARQDKIRCDACPVCVTSAEAGRCL